MPDDLSTFTVPSFLEEPPVIPAPQKLTPRPAAPNEIVYPYESGKDYFLEVPLNYPLDILLEPGETLQNLVGGDRTPVDGQDSPPWMLKDGHSGDGLTMQAHVFLTVSKPGLTLGLIITTTRRIYYLTAKSVQRSPIRAVRWHYPEQAPPVPLPAPPALWPDPTQGQQWHVGYIIDSHGAPNWLPVWVGDNGAKVFIVFPATSLYDTVPLVRGIGSTGPFLVNSRQRGHTLMIDQLAGALELRLGTEHAAETVTIHRGMLRTIRCPGDMECPPLH